MLVLPLIQGLEVPPDILHIGPRRVGRPHGCVAVPAFQYSVRSVRVCLSCCRIQERPDRCCSLLKSSPRVHQQGDPDGLGDVPRHVMVVTRVAAEGCPHINQPDGFGGHPEGERGALRGGGARLQVIYGLELHSDPADFTNPDSVLIGNPTKKTSNYSKEFTITKPINTLI